MAVAEEAAVGAGAPGSPKLPIPFSNMKLVLVALAWVVLVPTAVAVATDHGEYPVYSGDEFQDLYTYAVGNTLPNLEDSAVRYEITGDDPVDELIWNMAIERGYELRPTASHDLVYVGGVPMQPDAADAWVDLRAEAREAGMGFAVSSAYRSPSSQRSQFLSKLEGTSDEQIDATLTWYSLPGTSKHHSGYALDFRYADGTFGEFRATPDYQWLTAENFAAPKRHGFVPSYPDDVTTQGPSPEPWEFVWVGTALIRCGLPRDLPALAGPVDALVDDIAACPGDANLAVPDWLHAG